MTFDREKASLDMIQAGRAFYQFGWLLGTSGNLSVRASDSTFLITASGKNKGELQTDDFLLCDLRATPAEPTIHKPSAETLVHSLLYAADPKIGAIFHVHHLDAALCSTRDEAAGETVFEGLEMIKGLDIWDRERISVPIVPNHLEIPKLAEAILGAMTNVPSVMVLRHGFYAWGQNAFEARRHVETLAYLYSYAYRRPMS